MSEQANPYQPPEFRSTETPSPESSENLMRPSNTRFGVLAFLCSMAFILYLDRICFGQAATQIQEMDIPLDWMGWIHASHTLAYGLCEVHTGHWGDRYGSRRILSRIVVCWSIFTTLTAQCIGFWSLLTVRFLFGAGEAGAFPNAARIVRRWFAPSERGRIQGIFNAASLAGGALAPPVTSFLNVNVGWRWTFVIFGALGVVWAIAFYLWFRDDPAEHSGVNAGELEWLAASQRESAQAENLSIPWRQVLANRTIWLLGTATICSSFNSYFYFSWYPSYLKLARGVEEQTSGILAGMVLTGGMVGTLLGGWLLDRFVLHSLHRTRARRWLSCSALFMAAIFPMFFVQFESPLVSALCSTVSIFGIMCAQINWWSSATELSGRHLGALFGLMNGVGVIGAMSSQIFVGKFVKYRETLGYVGREKWDFLFYPLRRRAADRHDVLDVRGPDEVDSGGRGSLKITDPVSWTVS